MKLNFIKIQNNILKVRQIERTPDGRIFMRYAQRTRKVFYTDKMKRVDSM